MAEARSKLPKAMQKSDISSTKNEYYSGLIKKRHSLSPNMHNKKKNKKQQFKIQYFIK